MGKVVDYLKKFENESFDNLADREDFANSLLNLFFAKYKLDPQIKPKFFFEEMQDDVGGFYTQNKNKVAMNGAKELKDPESLANFLLTFCHEIWHFMQNKLEIPDLIMDQTEMNNFYSSYMDLISGNTKNKELLPEEFKNLLTILDVVKPRIVDYQDVDDFMRDNQKTKMIISNKFENFPNIKNWIINYNEYDISLEDRQHLNYLFMSYEKNARDSSIKLLKDFYEDLKVFLNDNDINLPKVLNAIEDVLSTEQGKEIIREGQSFLHVEKIFGVTKDEEDIYQIKKKEELDKIKNLPEPEKSKEIEKIEKKYEKFNNTITEETLISLAKAMIENKPKEGLNIEEMLQSKEMTIDLYVYKVFDALMDVYAGKYVEDMTKTLDGFEFTKMKVKICALLNLKDFEALRLVNAKVLSHLTRANFDEDVKQALIDTFVDIKLKDIEKTTFSKNENYLTNLYIEGAVNEEVFFNLINDLWEKGRYDEIMQLLTVEGNFDNDTRDNSYFRNNKDFDSDWRRMKCFNIRTDAIEKILQKLYENKEKNSEEIKKYLNILVNMKYERPNLTNLKDNYNRNIDDVLKKYKKNEVEEELEN